MQTDYNEKLESPSWLSEEYLENLLQLNFTDKTIKIKKLFIQPATAKGEHYASVMVRTKIDYIGENDNAMKSISLIIKSTFEDELANQQLDDYDVFNLEIIQYDRILPAIYKLLHTSGDTSKLSANAFNTNIKNKSLILEDLSISGYSNPDRVKGVNLEQAKLLITKLSKYHAASAVLYENDKTYFKYFDKGMFNRKSTAFNSFFEANFDSAVNEISHWGPDFLKYYEKLNNLKEIFIEKATAVFDLNKTQFNVLNHGDLWSNNIMFRYENEKPIDVLIVDYQLCSWNSPVLDLIYFFTTSLAEELKEAAINELIQFYHMHLVETLQKLRYRGKIPTLHELQIEYLEKQFYEFIIAFLLLPILLEDRIRADRSTLFDINSEKNLKYRQFIYSNEKLQGILKKLLPKLDQIGVLDC